MASAFKAAVESFVTARVSEQTRSHLRHLAVIRWLVFENRNLLLAHGQVGDHGGPGLEREQRLAGLRPGDSLNFTDAREALRCLRITGSSGPCRWAETEQTAYVTPETVLHLHRHGRGGKGAARRCRVGGILAPEGYLLLRRGDVLRLTRSLLPGKNASIDPDGRMTAPATIGCTFPQVYTRVRPGDRVWLDDGRIGGVVRSADRSAVTVEITAARPQGDKLRGEKGINLPDTDLGLPALSKKDREDLRFIARHAHLVGLSFAQRTEDIIELQGLLRNLGRPDLGVILKIETRRGFEMLPDLLLAAMHGPTVSVMIARGDLAVEYKAQVGFPAEGDSVRQKVVFVVFHGQNEPASRDGAARRHYHGSPFSISLRESVAPRCCVLVR